MNISIPSYTYPLENSSDHYVYPSYPPRWPDDVWPGNPLYPVWPLPGGTGDTGTTFTITTGEITPMFLLIGDEYSLTIDVPGFGKENDMLEVYTENGNLLVVKNSMRTSYTLPEKLDKDTLSVKVEFGQIIITADVKEQYERKSIPIEFRR